MAGGIDFSRFAPASPAEAIAAGVAPSFAPLPGEAVSVGDAAPPAASVPHPVPQAPAAVAPAVAAPPAKAAPRFVGGALRYMEVPLAYPLEFDGVVWEAIPLRRPSAADVQAYFEVLAVIGPEEWRHFPIYARADGTPVPSEVIDHLDPDDFDAVQEAAADFLCARLRRLQAASRESSTPPAPASTGPTSST